MEKLASPVRARMVAFDLVRGAVGGLVAGGAFLIVNMWFATSMNDPAKMPLLMMSTIVLGNEAIMDGSASVGVGLLVHAVLSIAFGVAFSFVAYRLRRNGSLALAGTLYGVVLYLVNFTIFAPAAFTVFEDANEPFEFVAHVMFGVLLSLAFFSTGARREDPVIAIAGR
jgi:uncharacterized membrane protein YagU involved in acid resistance